MGRTGRLAGILLSLILLTSCGGGEISENPETSSPEIQLRPKIAEGLKLTREKKYDEAISKVFEVVINNPEDAEALAVLSYIYLKSNRLPHAREMAERALAIDSYLDGELNPAEWDRLRGWLDEDPAHVDLLTERAFLHSRLHLNYAHRPDAGPEKSKTARRRTSARLRSALRVFVNVGTSVSRKHGSSVRTFQWPPVVSREIKVLVGMPGN